MRKTILIISVLFILTIFNLSGENAAPVSDLFGKSELGKPVTIENLTVFPVYNKSAQKSSLILLDEALSKKYLEITEVDGGNVPKVKITNLSDKTIFVMGGEIITGCKQDRIIARDFIIAPKRKGLVVPVFCVEAGRWTEKSGNFYSKNNLGTFKMRKEAQKNEVESQSKIWGVISEYNTRNKVSAGTSAYQDGYEKKEVKESVEKVHKELKKIEALNDNTIGIIVAVGDKIISMDIFGNNKLFSGMYEKIIKASYYSMISEDYKGKVSYDTALLFFKNINRNDYSAKEALDLGKEYLISDKSISMNALIYENNTAHISGFPVDKDTEVKIKEEDQRSRYNSRDFINRR